MARFVMEKVEIPWPQAEGQVVNLGYLMGIAIRGKVPPKAELLRAYDDDDVWGWFSWRRQASEVEERKLDADDKRRAAEIDWIEREDRRAGF